DLVEQRSLVDQERVVSARLRELDRLKDEFLANTSHELRTPLYGITGLAEAMVDGSAGPVSDDVKANLGMIIASGRRLSHLVGDILDFSKMRHDGLELEKRPVDLKSVVDVVLTLSQPLVGSNRLELVNQVPRDLPPVAADENRLQQILHNLVGNAIKFTEEGQIEITAAVEDGQVVTRVSDTGIGIPESDQARIFEAFVQADASMDREFAGTGLGLAVTRQLVELHGGKLWLESTLGEGSTFLFGLPTAAGEAPAVALEPSRQLRPILVPESAEPALSTPLQPSETGVDAEPARILVVDDEPVNRQVLRGYLAIEHYQVTLASGGDQALRLLEEQSFDLMLLDVMMPRVSGYEVCKALRSSHRLAELPVIFLTARSQDSDAVTGMSLGANDYLTKPISKDHLLARVRSHLELLRFHRNLEQRVAEKMAEVKVLEGLLPICAGCKKIRDREDEWHSLETYIASHSEAEFSHGLCPDCVKKYQVLPDGPLGVDSSAS
ncbi:MAG: response regulator, partial [Acidobacteriota bacterium]